ncbi:MAG: DUF3471 domain-containing protein, partial [Calditrichaeota bacterium]
RNALSSYIIGSTNLYTTIDDMLLWNMFLLNPPVEQREIRDQLFNPSDILTNGDTIRYTYGFKIWKYKGRKIAEHGGYTNGFLARNTIFPDLNFAVTAMFNTENIDIWKVCMQTADSLLKAQLQFEPEKERVEAKIDPKIYADYMGDFQFPDGMKLSFEAKNDTLWLLIPGAPRFRMVPESETEFFLKEFDAQCTFVNTQGAVNEIIWHQNGENPKGIRKVSAAELTEQAKALLIGKYFQPQLNVVYEVTVDNNQLIIHLPQTFKHITGIDPHAVLNHLEGDRFFVNQIGVVEFQRQSKRKISGLIFKDVGRGRNIQFIKL